MPHQRIGRHVWTDPPVPRFQAIWLEGPVPSRYWEDSQNRRRYMRWLGQRLGYRKAEDWYKITTDDFKHNRGGAVLAHYWDSSAVAAVKEYLFRNDWEEWLFGVCPKAFWKDRFNRRRYMQWLGERLGFRDPEDWYQVTNKHFADNKGGALMLCYDSTVSAAVMDYLPDYDWKEWMFSKTPKGFWDKKKNRRRYLKWLGKRLGLKKPDDWYSVTCNDFDANYGNQLRKRYQGSTSALIKDCFPRRTWNEWMFDRVPVEFWDDRKNRRRYIQWLGRRLRIRQSKDWYRVRRRDILENYGGGLLFRYDSYLELLKECVPGLGWSPTAVAQARSRTRVSSVRT